MMLRVRPAQLTTTAVSRFCFNCSTHKNQVAAGNVYSAGMQNLAYSSGVRTSRITSSAAPLLHSVQLLRRHIGNNSLVMDFFAERLARNIDAADGRPSIFAPCGQAAIENRNF